LTSIEISRYYEPTGLAPRHFLYSQTAKLIIWTALWTFFVVRAALVEMGWQDVGSRAVLGFVDGVFQ
jgi:hypothetical protein